MARKDPFEYCTAGGCCQDLKTKEVTHTALCSAYNTHLGSMTDAFLSNMGDDTLFLDTYGLAERFEKAIPKHNGDMNRPTVRAAAALLLACKELEAYLKAENPDLPAPVFHKGAEMPFFHQMRMSLEEIKDEDL